MPTRSTPSSAPPAARVTRTDVLRHRLRAQQLDRERAGDDWLTTTAVLDAGVQETGPDGAGWALALRGAPVTAATAPDELVVVWSVRGAPHAYRRSEVRDVARALVPWSEADARKRVFDAAKPLVAAGIEVREALAEVATRMREVVTGPTSKGDLSGALTQVLPEPYLRWCRSCDATHAYEMPFRLAALHAGLELEPGTSPPVLRRLPRWPGRHVEGLPEAVLEPPAQRSVPAHLDLVRAYLRLLGPAVPKDVAAYLDAPAADVTRRLADLREAGEVVDVEVDGERRVAPAADVGALTAGGPSGVVRLLGPFDLFLQGKDRELLVPDPAQRKALWPVLGRPGAVVRDGEVVGTWRPRASGRRLAVLVDPWVPWDRSTERAVDEQIERLAAYRGVEAAGRTTA